MLSASTKIILKGATYRKTLIKLVQMAMIVGLSIRQTKVVYNLPTSSC